MVIGEEMSIMWETAGHTALGDIYSSVSTSLYRLLFEFIAGVD